jgi:hypothetical protein
MLPTRSRACAPRLWTFPPGARTLSHVQAPSDSGSPDISMRLRTGSTCAWSRSSTSSNGKILASGCGNARIAVPRGTNSWISSPFRPDGSTVFLHRTPHPGLGVSPKHRTAAAKSSAGMPGQIRPSPSLAFGITRKGPPGWPPSRSLAMTRPTLTPQAGLFAGLVVQDLAEASSAWRAGRRSGSPSQAFRRAGIPGLLSAASLEWAGEAAFW